MNRSRCVSSIVPLAALVAYCASAVAQDVRIEHVTVVSPERSSQLTDVTVVIRGDRIASISSNARARAAGSSGTAVQIINGRGLYLAPGLIDSQVHGRRTWDDAGSRAGAPRPCACSARAGSAELFVLRIYDAR